ncbi:ABC transporter ATP-binding protein [Pseudoflavonifractor capillosus]|mgnify:CR=1 FL=1|uniref:ABC transporter ATP-binding protein n=1 Tax=Pseudoflavonifractor capillosus TaxID=106588 RepID=UPI00195B5AAB|nr:ABC transporter ATP-binding protein [Pseudoflavonifractor capillosus]MBM6896035.1 ABC transporter ATP-binding protein [Pseudoflavonifractor capillosus]
MSELTLQDVCYRYKNTERDVLHSISCKFESGNVYAIVGPSGSGKSTLLSLMAGLDTPTHGELTLDQVSYNTMDLDRTRREKLSMIFQAFQLFPLLTAVENVSFPMETNGVSKAEAKRRATELLAEVGIHAEKHRRYPSNLSGGEQQRVAIARALSTGAGILLADEPTGNLDEANSIQVMDLLLHLAHALGRCVIVVTHDLDLASRADNILYMRDGTLTQQ